MAKSLLSKPNFQVCFEPANSLIRIYWQGEVQEKDLLTGYHSALECIRQNPVRRILIDHSKRKLLMENDPDPIFEHMFNEVLKSIGDTLFLALVVSKAEYFLNSEANIFGKFEAIVNNHVIVERFLTCPEAEAWLASVK